MKRALLLSLSLLVAQTLLAQQRGGTTTAPANAAAKPAPRMADGHPDLSGVWWGGSDVGGRPAPGTPGALGPAAPRGGAAQPAPPSYQSLYQPWAAEKAKNLGDKDDPT